MASTIIVSYSELDTFRQCPFKHELAYKQRWTRPVREGSALARGTGWHNLLEAHYKLLKKTDIKDLSPEVMLKTVSPYLYDKKGNQTEDQELIQWMYEGYLKLYGLDEEWEILAVEKHSQFWLPTETGHRSRFKLKFKIDIVARNRKTGKIWIWDHKSCKNLPNQKMLELDDQFGLYTWGMRQLGFPITGSMHNATRTQRNKDDSEKAQPLDSRNLRTLLYRTDPELDMIALEAYRTAKRAYAIKEGQADRAPDTDRCSWRCDYTEQCLGSRKGVDIRGMLLAADFEQDFTRH